MNKNCNIGDVFITNEGYKAKVIEYRGWYNVKVELDDKTILNNLILGSLKKGFVKNPMHKTSYGIGFLGQGKYTSVGKDLQKYTIWKAMLQRCYDKNYQEKQPTYVGCTVDERWHNFQNFAQWFEDNYKDYMESWQLDKDILVKDNKIYSPETCNFIPRDINVLFCTCKGKRGDYPIGVKKKINRFQAVVSKGDTRVNLGSFKTPEQAFLAYKKAKEDYIKEVADKYKNQITKEVYQTLYNYKVEITD